MGIYIYKESNGHGLVFIESQTQPTENKTIKIVNGSDIPTDRQAYELIKTVTGVNAAAQWSNKNEVAIKDAMQTIVANLGGGDVETGFDLLSNAEKVIAASHSVGSAAQIAAYAPIVPTEPAYTLDIIA